MSLRRWDPWEELERLRAEMDRVWDHFLDKLTRSGPAAEQVNFLPDADFVETGGEYRLYLSVPGLVEEDMDLFIADRSVIIRGERQPPYDPGHTRRRIGEWRYGFFERRFQFPEVIEREAVRAHYDAGVLTIILPKA